MEILYLRVFKTYYNPPLAFENVDINLNGEHHFFWDSNKGGVEYQENKNYNKELYGPDIKINVVVGSNGSGKSTLFKFIRFLTAKLHGFDTGYSYHEDHWDWVAIINDEGLKKVTPLTSDRLFFGYDLNFEKISVDYPAFKGINGHKGLSTSIHFSPFLDFEALPFPDAHYINVTSDGLLNSDTHANKGTDNDQMLNFRRSEIKRQIAFIRFANFQASSSLLFYKEFVRKKILIFFDPFVDSIGGDMRYVEYNDIAIYKLFKKHFSEEYYSLHYSLKEIVKKTDQPIQEANELIALIFYRKLLETIFRNAEYRGDPKSTKKHNFLITIQSRDSDYYFTDRKNVIDNFKEFFRNIDDDYLPEEIKNDLLEIIREFENLIPGKLFYNFNDNCVETDLATAEELVEIENKIHSRLPFDAKLRLLTMDWGDISTGERAYLNLFSRLHHAGVLMDSHPELALSKYLYFLIDEPATGFHPQWQKEYLTKLLQFLSLRFVQKKHVLISTHSPFILSDVQKPDVIALNRGGQNDINVTQTFGANIHELFADSFFLQNGFIGDFSRSKIQDLVRFLKFDENKPDGDENQRPKENWSEEKASNLIAIIGEPLIKERLQNIFDKKFQMKDIAVIKSRIEALQSELKKAQNAKDSN